MISTPDVSVAAAARMPVAGLISASITTLGMSVLFGSETVFAALALDWAAGGLLHLPVSVQVTAGTIPLAAALYATYRVARRTWRFERAEACAGRDDVV